MFGCTSLPETNPAAAHERAAAEVLLDVRQIDEWAAGLPVVRDDGRPGTVI